MSTIVINVWIISTIDISRKNEIVEPITISLIVFSKRYVGFGTFIFLPFFSHSWKLCAVCEFLSDVK